MPASVVKNKAGEEAWTRAKAQVNKEYPDVPKDSDRYYQLVMHIYKSICTSPKHDCGPTLRTNPSSRKESMSTSELLSRLEESAGELVEMDGMSLSQDEMYREIMSSVGYGEVKNPEAAVKAATKRIHDTKMANCRHDLDIAGRYAVNKLKKIAAEREARKNG